MSEVTQKKLVEQPVNHIDTANTRNYETKEIIMNNKTEKINNISNDKTLDTLLKFRREFISLMLEYENKLTEEENRALEQAYRGYIKFFSKWLKRNGYIDNDEE